MCLIVKCEERRRMMKILILTAKYGMGHVSAANSIKEEIEKFHPGAQVEIVDFYEYSMPFLAKYMYKAFKAIVKYTQSFYIKFYEQNDREKSTTDIITKKFACMTSQIISEEKPDMIISTFPMISQGVGYYKEVYGGDIHLVTVITDVSSHYEWLNPYTDAYLVASHQLKEKIVEKGIDEDKVHVFGIPVSNKFKKIRINKARKLYSKKSDKLAVLGEYKKKKELLIIGGGLGILPDEDTFYDKLNRIDNLHTTLVVGNNENLYNLINGRYENIEVLGFTDRVPELMEKADCVMTKPGGITVFEAIYSMTPIISFDTKLPNELKNQDFIVDEDFGIVLHTGASGCLDMVERFVNNTKRLDRIRNSMFNYVNGLERNYFYKELYINGDFGVQPNKKVKNM